jgi:aromatic ring-opening dioxygenase LigB subunit
MISYAAFLPHPPILIPGIGHNDKRILSTYTAQFGIAQEIKALEKNTDVLVIMSPHAPADRKHIPLYVAETYAGDFGEFDHSEITETFLGSPAFSRALVTAVSGVVPVAEYGSAGLDHGVMVPLYSLHQLGYQKPICVLGVSYESEDHYRFGAALALFAHATKKNIVFVGSGDMSHALKGTGPYQYDPAGPKFDKLVEEYIREGQERKLLEFSDTFLRSAAECGYRSLLTIAGIRSEIPELAPEVLSYEGPFGVGYLTARWRK